MINPSGTPKILYHGTIHKFNEFRTGSEFGIHVGDLDAAKAINSLKCQEGVIMELYVKLVNPLKVPDMTKFDAHHFVPIMNEGLVGISLESMNIINEYYEIASSLDPKDSKEIKRKSNALYDVDKTIIEEIKSNGYDGIVYDNQREGRGKSYILFESNQVKSVNNTGTWSSTDDNIYN